MPPSSRRKAFHYKQATFVGEDAGRLDLKSLLEQALTAVTKPTQRFEKLGEEGDHVRFISKSYTHGTLIAGRFLDFTEGGAKSVLRIDQDADDLEIRYVTPGAEEQFLHSILTFGVRKNHVVLIQSQGLKTRHLEDHLNWFLRERTRVLPQGASLALRDHPRRELRDKLAGVEWIELFAGINVSSFREETEERPNNLPGRVIEEIRSLMPSRGNILERLSPQAALAMSEVDLSIRLARRGRAKEGPSLIDEIAHTLRHVDDVPFKLKTRNGIFSSDEFKLSGYFQVPCDPDGAPRLADSAEIMQGYLAELISERQVDDLT